MEEWKEYKLGELSIGKGSYGIGASAVPYSPSLHTYLRITDINDDGSLNKNGLMSLDDENADDYILQPNDIVFARTGNSTGRSYFYDGSDGKLVYAGFLIKFSLDSKKVNPRILKYYTHSKPYFDWVRSFDTGGTRGNINAKTYGDMPIVLPPRKLQDKIVSILKSLDDKIEVNRKINENLEQQAQALFKSWFEDFEPFKNGEFVESELGMIPLSEICEQITDGVHNSVKDEPNSNYMLLSCKNIVGGVLSKNNYRSISKSTFESLRMRTKLAKGDILLSSVGTIGEIAIVEEDPINYEFQRSVAIIKPKKNIGTYFLYNALLASKARLQHAAHGAVQQCIFIGDLKKFEVICYDTEKASHYNESVRPLFEEIAKLHQESHRLAELRDTLLPKLMSGELKVSEIVI